MAKTGRSGSKSKKRKPSFDLPRAPSEPIDASWVYRSDTPNAVPPSAAARSQQALAAAQPTRRPPAAAESDSVPLSLLKGTLYWVELSLDIGEAVPTYGFKALQSVAGFVPGAGMFVGILGVSVQVNSAAVSVGKRLIHAISGETISATH